MRIYDSFRVSVVSRSIVWMLVFVLGLGMFAVACSPTPPADESAAESQTESAAEFVADGGNQVPGDANTIEQPPTEPNPTIETRASGPNKSIDPGKPGPYTVGVTTLRLSDTSRVDDKTKEPRPMVVEIWYPAVDDANKGTPDAYQVSNDAPPAVQDRLKQLGIEVPAMKQNAFRDAEPLRKEGPYPIILFSHGSGGIRYQSVFQTVHLASHGYVVVSVDHAGNTLYDLFLDPKAQDPTRLFKAAVDRPLDVKFSLEEVKKRAQHPQDRFHQLIDFSKIGTTGHSFGGMTSILVLAHISGIQVVVPQAPHTSLLSALGVEAQHVRNAVVMVHAAKDDRTLSYDKEEKAFYDLAITEPYHNTDRYLVTLERGGHFSYSNICELDLKKYASRLGFGNVDSILSDGCATHNTPILEAHRIINHYATAIFNKILRQSPSARDYLIQMAANKEITFAHTPPPSPKP